MIDDNSKPMQANLKPHSRLAQWSAVDESEMKQFIGLLTWMATD